ncbi:COLEC12 [Mytilus coruscus]|uniref:COLEC12 n=1 Tax=Mytilus coruscus TaxID=42192 RepID=A0A6J8BR83_MYTCO|nr:COLEC12 [Mytilus coruscus]
MRLASMITLCILGMAFKDVIALRIPCLSNDSKTKFEDTRKALKVLQTSIDNRATILKKKLDDDMGSLQTDMKNKIKKLDEDIGSLVSDFRKKQWKNHKGHCYYYGSERLTWFQSEQRCRQIGGYLATVDDETENKWIIDNRTYKDHLWIGLTDLKEGEYRWSYDQTIAKYTPWYSGWGSKGTGHNCGLMYQNHPYTWLDYPCTQKFNYVCESHLYIYDLILVKYNLWMGLTELKEGEFRWSYDQTLAKYKPWYNGWGNKGTSYNCGLMYHNTYTRLDYPCSTATRYVCESHICKY